MAYDAFISYSHAADGRLAPTLQAALHRFAKPWWKIRALNVFRDETSLAAASSLSGAILGALDQARHFILLASPGAAGSKWVANEVRHWLAHKSADRILIVLTEGVITWDDAALDFDWAKTDALPDALKGAFASEPFWLDLSWVKASEQLSAREPRFQQSVAKLAATLHGKSLEEISGEEVRQYRRTRRLARAAMASLAVLAAAAGTGAYVAFQAQERAEREAEAARRARGAAEISERLATERMRLAQINESQVFLQRSRERMAEGDIAGAVTAALAGLPLNLDRPERPIHRPLLDHMLAIGLGDRLRGFLVTGSRTVSQVEFHPGGEEVAVVTGNEAGIWNTRLRRLRRALTGHTGKIVSLAFSRDGKYVLTASEDRTARLWDNRTGQSLHVLRGHTQALLNAVFSGDGTRIVTSAQDGTFRLWSVADGASLATAAGVLSGIRWARLLAVDWAGRHIAIPDAGYVALRRFADGGKLELVARHHGFEGSAAFTDDGSKLVAGGLRGLAVIDVESGAIKAQYATAAVLNIVRLTGDGRRVLAGAADGTVTIWDIGTEKPVTSLRGHGARIVSVAAEPGEKTVVSSAADGTLRLWSVEHGTMLASLKLRRTDGASPALNADGSLLAAPFEQGIVALFDTRDTGHEVALEGNPDSLLVFALSPDSRYVFGSIGDAIQAHLAKWETATGRRVPGFLPDPGHAFARRDAPVLITADADRLVTASRLGRIEIWDAATGRRLGGFESGKTIADIRIGADGGRLLIVPHQTGRLELRDLEGRMIAELPDVRRNSFAATDAQFTADGRMLVVADRGTGLALYDAQSGRRLRALATTAQSRIALDPRGERVAAAPAGAAADPPAAIILLDLESGQIIREMAGRHRNVNRLVFSGDGKRLAGAMPDSSLRIWDTDTGQEIAVIPEAAASATDFTDGTRLAFSPAGDAVLSFTRERYRDPALRIFNVADGGKLLDLRRIDAGAAAAQFAPDRLVIAWLGPRGTLQLSSIALHRAEDIADYYRLAAAPDSASLRASPPVPLAGASPARDRCDDLAADPFDAQRAAPGVAQSDLEIAAAIEACAAATARAPDSGRFHYQYARALRAAGYYNKAMPAFETSLRLGHQRAGLTLGHLFEHGIDGALKRADEAARAFRAAYDAGYIGIGGRLGFILWSGGPGLAADRAAAVKLWEEAAERGDSNSHRYLSQVHQFGALGKTDFGRALFHRAIASFDMAHDGGPATLLADAAVRANIAKQLGVSTAARLWRERLRGRIAKPE